VARTAGDDVSVTLLQQKTLLEIRDIDDRTNRGIRRFHLPSNNSLGHNREYLILVNELPDRVTNGNNLYTKQKTPVFILLLLL